MRRTVHEQRRARRSRGGLGEGAANRWRAPRPRHRPCVGTGPRRRRGSCRRTGPTDRRRSASPVQPRPASSFWALHSAADWGGRCNPVPATDGADTRERPFGRRLQSVGGIRFCRCVVETPSRPLLMEVSGDVHTFRAMARRHAVLGRPVRARRGGWGRLYAAVVGWSPRRLRPGVRRLPHHPGGRPAPPPASA